MMCGFTIKFHSFLKAQKDFSHRFTQTNADDKTKKDGQNKRVSVPILLLLYYNHCFWCFVSGVNYMGSEKWWVVGRRSEESNK